MKDDQEIFFFQGLGWGLEFEASAGVLFMEREGERDQALDLLEAQFVFPSALALPPHTGNIMNSSLFVSVFFFLFSMRPILQLGIVSISVI